MFHANRVWTISEVATAQELTEKLTTTTWCCCQGFHLDGLLWLNDATGPDGAQEYAAVKVDHWPQVGEVHGHQVESVTFSWIETTERALQTIEEITGGRYYRKMPVRFMVEDSDRHRCPLCI